MVWISKITQDTRLLKPLVSDAPGGQIDIARRYWSGANTPPFPDDWPVATRIWVNGEGRDQVSRLPDLFSAGVWIVSERLATVLSRFDLGRGGLWPVAAFQKDRATPIPGSYFCLTFPNVKRAFRAEQSRSLRNFLPGVSTTRAVLAPGDLACSEEALAGADIWIDPALYGAIFLSGPLVAALDAAEFKKAFDSVIPLAECRIVPA